MDTMSANYEISGFTGSTEHWEIDGRQRVEDVIKKEIRECGASLEQVKAAVVNEIQKCRESPTLVENRVSNGNTWYRDWGISKLNVIPDLFYNIYKTVRINQNDGIQQPVENETKVPAVVSLSTIDHAYIDQMYAKCCSKVWLQEAIAHANETTRHQDHDTIQDLLYSMGTIQSFNQIPEPFNQLKYYKLLIQINGLISWDVEKASVEKFKKEFFQLMITYSHSVKSEVNFLRIFMDFLLAYKNTEAIEAELQLQTFCHGDSPFDELLDRIINLDVDANGTELTALQEVAKCLKQKEQHFATEKFKEVVKAYLKPVEIRDQRLDGRLVIEATGRCIVISKILDQLETKLRCNPVVEEVRIVGADILHIDANIENVVWHGMNIVIVVDKIKIHNKVIWDVSGKDSDHVYSENAGTGEDGHGKQGAEGCIGESGGNILILANEVENPENFTLISHGGKGSNGQDGGDGKDGQDGTGISKTDFDGRFPSVVKCFASSSERTQLLLKTVQNIIDSGTLNRDWAAEGNRYIESTTTHGNRITFSFCASSVSTRFQAFLLYGGSLGQPGGSGGDHGLGGEGGYSGEIITSDPNIVVLADQGKNGINGKGGCYGRHGKNGWDMGYTDYQTWPNTRFYGSDCSSKLHLEYHDNFNTSDGRVWCPYQDKYAGFTSCHIEHKIERKYEERKNVDENSERQRETQAVKKKNISRSKISADYAHHFTSVGRRSIENLESSLQNINQQALQAMTESTEQQEKATIEVNVKHHIRSTRQSIGVPCKRIINSMSCGASRQTTEQSFNSLNCELKSDLLSDYLLRLKSAELNRSELDKLFIRLDSFKSSLIESEELKNNAENCKIQHIEQILNETYRFAVLREIANQLPTSENVRVNPKLTAEKAAKYLIVVKDSKNNISHSELGTLDKYLFQNNKRQLKTIFQFLKKESKKSANEAFKRSVGKFVLRVGKSVRADIDVKKYYTEYTEHSEKRDHSLKIFLAPFLSELQQKPHVFALWTQSNNNKAIKFELKNEIKKCTFLNALYNRVDKQLKLVYNWDECYNNKSILKKYNRHIREEGQFSESYRELLAFIFNINIRLYIEDPDDRFCLLDNHNPCSKQVVHILQRDNKLVPLNIDENLFKLGQERENQDKLYTKILSETQLFKQKEEFDDYCLNERFLPDNNTLDNEYSFNKEPDAINFHEDYFSGSGEDWQMIKCLEKISPQYIGHESILRNLLKRFFNDGMHVSYQELYCLVNSILASVIDDKVDLNTFCWIVVAYPQKCWIDELVLLQIENHFKTQITDKLKWREYMLRIENKDILLSLRLKLSQFKSSGSTSVQCVEDALILLSKIPNAAVSFENLDLPEWPYALKEKYWTYKLSQLTNWEESNKLSEASYYLLSAENTFGTSMVERIVDILKKKKEPSPDTITEILLNFYNEKWNLGDDELTMLSNSNITDWTENMSHKFTADQKDRDVAQLVEVIKGNANTSKEILDKLPEIQKSIEDMYEEECPVVTEFSSGIIEIDQLECQQQTCEEWMYTYRSEISEQKHSINQACVKMLTIIDKAIELKRNFKLRDTQKLSVLALLANERSTLAQVSTGEGKSLIVVVASIITIALRGDSKVDIITSSSVLAKRDAEVNKDIYNLFGINVSHNCNEDVEKRRDAYSSSQVVYGDLSNFQRDYLLDRFYGKNILGDRNFENVIVDEVDSMLLDKGNNMLYLSHDFAGLDKLESIYLFIWQWVNRPAGSKEELSSAFDAAAIKEVVLNDLHDRIAKEDIKQLGSELDEQHAKMIWERLIDAKILDDQGKILKENVNDNELTMVLHTEFIRYKDRLCYLVQKRMGRERLIQVPNYLKPFIEQHLESWINSAIMAVVMKQGHDYVLDVDRTGTSSDLNPNVTILDRDTGTDQANSQWDEALHQFLQLKHGCKLSLQSLKAVFISNVSYLKLYRKLYGLTGTLGSHRERDLLKEIHEVDFVTIPTSKPKQFQEDMPIFCSNKNEWIEEVFNEVTRITYELKRSVLIICETINDVETLKSNFAARDTKDVHTYTRDYKQFDIAKGNKKLGQGQIIIATNLSGRGTDIKITEALKQAGGLHVCLTYLPNNSRIEQQAFGRAARNGDKGSGRLIIMGSKGQGYGSDLKILDFKKQRDAEELRRISDIKAHYETQIIREEYCFAKFRYQYERLKKDLADNGAVSVEVQRTLLQSCLDKWAFWLDKNGECIKNVIDDQTERYFEDSLNEFISQLENLKYEKNNWLAWVEEQPVQMIKLGKHLCKDKKYDDAIKLFDKVVEREPYFSEAAHYYKAYALVKIIDWKKKSLDKRAVQELKIELREAARLFNERRDSSIFAGGIINNIKQRDNKSIIQIDSYAEQQESMCDLYYLFSQSIDNVFGQPVTPESFVNDDISSELSEVLYEDLLRNEILKKPTVKKCISEDVLRRISIDYGIRAGELNTLLSTFRGKEIDEKEFQKTLNDELKLASREDFWKVLIELNILNREVKYITINVENFRNADPTLFQALHNRIIKSKLRPKTLTCKSQNDEILLNAEQTGDQRDFLILEKNTFKSMINDGRKYAFLKKKGIFSFNKKARIDLGKIARTALPRYDSIRLEDFSNENIAMNDCAKILAELYDQKVLQTDSKTCVYRLKIPCSEIEKIQLPSFPIYQNAVKSLISLRFAYRIALEKIEKQIKEKSLVVHPRLTSKPHHNVFCELLNQRIIRSAKVNAKVDDLKRKVSDIYSRTINREDLKFILSQNGLITTEANADKLCDHLVAIRWLFIEQLRENSLGTESRVDHGCKFIINDPDKREPLELATVAYDIKNKIERTLDNRLQLANENTIAHIVKILERSKSSLKTLEIPDSNLKPLTECCGQGEFKHMEEINVFTLNGLSQLLQIAEKKWTKTMLLNTFIVAVMGVCQIAIGVTLEMYSIAASECIFEGISDIRFAIESLRSGYFHWKNYATYKIKNLISSLMSFVKRVVTTQIINGTTQTPRFGNKITGSLVELGTEITENSYKMNTSSTAKETAKCIAWEVAIKGIEFGWTHAGLDTVIKHQLQKLCDRISSIILSNIGNEIDKVVGYNFAFVEEIYQKLGKDAGREIINRLTQKSLTEESFRGKISDIAAPIVRFVHQEIIKVTENVQQTSTSSHISPIQDINNVIAQVSQSKQLVPTGDVLRITGDILRDLVENLKDRLDNQEPKNHANQKFPEQEQEAVQERESFKTDVIDQWKSLLLNAVGQVIDQQLVIPIFDEGCDLLIGHSKKMIHRRFRSYRRGRNNKRFEELKRQYQELRQTSDLTGVENYTAVHEYHENLLKLVRKTRNHKLLAAIIRENGPMDVPCLDMCTRVIRKILGICLTVIVKEKGGFRKKNLSSEDGVMEEKIIELELTDNYCRIHCFYEALSDQLLLLTDMTPERFRNEVADRIEQDPHIKYHIEHDWPELYTQSSRFDGRHRIEMVTDELWTDIIDENTKFLQDNMGHGRSEEPKQHVDESAEEIVEDKWPDEADIAVEDADGQVLPNARWSVKAAVVKSLKGLVKIAANVKVGELSSSYSDEDETSLIETLGKSTFCRAPKGRWTSLDYGLSFTSHNIAMKESQGHYESLKIAAQQVRELELKFWDPLKNRRRPSGRSKSLERLVVSSLMRTKNLFKVDKPG